MPAPDNLLRWLNICCPDWEEGGFSMNSCCPVSFSACVSKSKAAELCGYSELVDPSSPPKKYKVKTITRYEQVPPEKDYDYNIGEFSLCQNGCKSRSVSQYIYDYRDSYAKRSTIDTRTYDPLVSCSGFTTRDFIDNSEPRPPPNSSGTFAYYDFSTISNYTLTSSTLETTTITKNLRSYTEGDSSVLIKQGCGSPPYCDTEYNTYPPININAGYTDTETTTLSEEDTESAALSRVDDWNQGDSCVSSFNRDESSFEFSKTKVKHEAVVTRLVIGFCYEGVIPIKQAPVQYDESGTRLIPTDNDWLPFSLTAIDAFIADEVFQTFGGGTLNVSDDDFINENFSLDPYDYPSYFPVDPETGILVDPDALVLTAFSDLPESKISDYRAFPAIMRRIECEEN